MTREPDVDPVVEAIFSAIGATAANSDILALRDGRITFGGNFDAHAVATAARRAVLREESAKAGRISHAATREAQ